jgi:hypothetical protein
MRDTIDMAREDGKHQWPLEHDFLKRFEALVRADEREACAKVCEEAADDEMYLGQHYAEAIRARGNT